MERPNQEFDASQQWHVKPKIDATQHPIAEFNARGGRDYSDYLDHQEYMATDHPDVGEKNWEEIKAKLPEFEIIRDPISGQKLRVQKFNWPEDKKVEDVPVTIITMPFSVPISLDHIQYQHHLIAEELGGPVMVIENPSYGASDKLTNSQKDALAVNDVKDGDYGPIADVMLGIMFSQGINRINLIGYSMGAETAAAIAANARSIGTKVDNLLVMESPRVIDHDPLDLLIKFMSDASNLKFTWNHPIDPVLRKVAKIKPGLRGTLSYGRAMTRTGIAADLRQALSQQSDMNVTIASAGASKISPSSANNELREELKEEFPDHSINRVIIPGEGHAYGDSGKRFAFLARRVINGL